MPDVDPFPFQEDLAWIAEKFEQKYETSLYDTVEGECSGYYKSCLLSLIAGKFVSNWDLNIGSEAILWLLSNAHFIGGTIMMMKFFFSKQIVYFLSFVNSYTLVAIDSIHCFLHGCCRYYVCICMTKDGISVTFFLDF